MLRLVCLILLNFSIPFCHAFQTTVQDFARSVTSAQQPYEIDTLQSQLEQLPFAPEETIKLGTTLLKRSTTLSYAKGRAISFRIIGKGLLARGTYDSAETVLLQASSILKDLEETIEKAENDFNLALSQYIVGAYDKAAQTVVNNLDNVKDTDPKWYNTLLRMVGEIHRAAHNNKTAIQYLTTAVAHSEEYGFQQDLAANLNRLGVVYYQDSEHELAKQTLEKSLALAQKIQYDRVITMNLNDMGELYFTLGDYERCIELYEIALKREMVTSDQANTYTNIARLYAKLNDHDKAINYARKSLEIATNENMLTYQVDATRLLAESYTQTGQFKKASESYSAHTAFRDSLFNIRSRQQLKEVEARYQTEKKELEIANLTEKEALERGRKQTYRAGLLVVAVLLILVAILAYQVNRNKQRLEQQKKELEDLNTTKDKFFSIIAHDLRSPMIALQGVGQKLEYFIKKEKRDKLLEMGDKIDISIDKLNHLLNNLLNWAASQTGGIPYHPSTVNSKAIVEEVIDLYKNLAESKDIKIKARLKNLNVYADPNTCSTVIRNLLSNAIKFTREGGEIVITNGQKESNTLITIKDQGYGMDKQTLGQLFQLSNSSKAGTSGEKGFGLGLKLCKEFVEMNKGSISVESEVGLGSVFTIALPQQAEAKLKRLQVA